VLRKKAGRLRQLALRAAEERVGGPEGQGIESEALCKSVFAYHFHL
jgi:hypothetical protein